MEFSVTIDLTAKRPITELQLLDLAELGGAASGGPGALVTSVTMTVNAVNSAVAGDVAARETWSVLTGASVDALEVITSAELARRLAR